MTSSYRKSGEKLPLKRRGDNVHANIGDSVKHLDRDERGEVIDIRPNPACH